MGQSVITAILFMLFLLTGATGQEVSPFGLGTWRTYFPEGEYIEMANGSESIIVANPFQLTLYYPDTEEVLVLNKENGLSDVGIVKVAYMATQDAVIVGYQNGNVDIVTPDKTHNLPGIKNNQNIFLGKWGKETHKKI